MLTNSLSVLDVLDRGQPNKERIPIKVESDCLLQNFWVGIGIKQNNERILPINDNMFWLGSGFAKRGDWIFVYTGSGIPMETQIPNQSNKIYTLHWNRDHVLFESSEIFPILLSSTIQTPPSFDTSQASNALVNALLGYDSD